MKWRIVDTNLAGFGCALECKICLGFLRSRLLFWFTVHDGGGSVFSVGCGEVLSSVCGKGFSSAGGGEVWLSSGDEGMSFGGTAEV